MNKAEKTNKIAGATGKTEKVLPGDSASLVSGNNLPAANPHVRPGSQTGSDLTAISAANGTTGSAMAELRARATERTHDIIAIHAVRLADSNLDAMRVVLKPGAGLQLSLEMRQHGDGIAAQVVVERGDHDHLNQHWPELQQRLERRGIQLAPLGESDNFAGHPEANGFQPPQREFNDADPLEASAFAAFALAGHPPQPSVPGGRSMDIYNGWETWA